jgi:hypothetical protein
VMFNENRMARKVGIIPGEATSLRTVLDSATDSRVMCRESVKVNTLHTCVCSKTRDHIPEDHYCSYCGKVFR